MKAGYKKFIEFLSIIILLVGPYFLVVQGIDFTDKGLMLGYSMQVFSFPEAYHSYSGFWLTAVIGHAWLLLFPIKGMLGLNILFVVLLQLNALAFFVILKKYYQSHILLPAISIAVFLNIPLIQNGFGYQCLTVVILNLAALLLFKGVKDNNNKYVFTSSLLLFLSVFVRLPNILGFVFFLLLIGHHIFIYKKVDKLLWKKIVSFLAGALLGVIFIILLLYSSGYERYFKEGINEIIFSAGNTDSAYNGSTLLSSYIRDVLNMTVISLKYLLLISLVVYTLSFFQIAFQWKGIVRKLHWLLPVFAIGLAIYISKSYDINYILKYHMKYVLPGLSIVIGSLFLLMQKQYKTEKIFLFISAITIYAISFAGSNTGMNPYGSMFLVFLVIAEMLSAIINQDIESAFSMCFSKNLSLFLVFILMPLAFLLNYQFVYRDDTNRYELKYSTHNSYVRGIYTSKLRAETVNGVLDVLSTKIHSGDEMWATPNLPLIYALTETKPYLNHPWENLLPPKQVEVLLSKAESSSSKLPLIVRAKGSTRNNFWPEKIIPETDKYSIERAELLKQFIFRHNYTMTWQNNFFEIWEANTKRF